MESRIRRLADDEVETLIADGAPAIAIDGAKGVGKTESARQFADREFLLDDPLVAERVRADPSLLVTQPGATLIDEWQHLPESWDLVRRAVDADPGGERRFLLTGSASRETPTTHTGAGRIITTRMRPLTLAERGVPWAVGLGDLVHTSATSIEGETDLGLPDYVEQITRGGFPGMARLRGRALRGQLDGYLERIVDREVPEAGLRVRQPDRLRRWLNAYAAATASTASYEAIRGAATPGEGEKLSKPTAQVYRDLLERIWVVDPVPAWLGPTAQIMHNLGQAPKHHLVDPALAARALGVTSEALLEGATPGFSISQAHKSFLGALFESLVTLNIRVYAQALECQVRHLRTHKGAHEVDLIVERPDGRIVAIEVKLAARVGHEDVRHLLWLRDSIGDRLVDAVVVTTGPYAFRREDGVAVIPAALLGP
ncbi:MAG: DUF4143 domain-containing protein [Nocardioidaceae bacterium]